VEWVVESRWVVDGSASGAAQRGSVMVRVGAVGKGGNGGRKLASGGGKDEGWIDRWPGEMVKWLVVQDGGKNVEWRGGCGGGCMDRVCGWMRGCGGLGASAGGERAYGYWSC